MHRVGHSRVNRATEKLEMLSGKLCTGKKSTDPVEVPVSGFSTLIIISQKKSRERKRRERERAYIIIRVRTQEKKKKISLVSVNRKIQRFHIVQPQRVWQQPFLVLSEEAQLQQRAASKSQHYIDTHTHAGRGG